MVEVCRAILGTNIPASAHEQDLTTPTTITAQRCGAQTGHENRGDRLPEGEKGQTKEKYEEERKR